MLSAPNHLTCFFFFPFFVPTKITLDCKKQALFPHKSAFTYKIRQARKNFFIQKKKKEWGLGSYYAVQIICGGVPEKTVKPSAIVKITLAVLTCPVVHKFGICLCFDSELNQDSLEKHQASTRPTSRPAILPWPNLQRRQSVIFPT